MVVILVIVGIGAGTLGSMVGIGGGIIIAPALTFLGFQPTQIASSSLVAVAFSSASSSTVYSKQGRIHYKIALKISALAIIGAITGAFLSRVVSLEFFKIYFAILLVLTGTYLMHRNSVIREKHKRESQLQSIRPRLLFYSSTFIAGIISSLFGIGGGIIFVPAMVIILGLTILNASATSQLALLITSVAGVFTHTILGHHNYIDALSLAVGASVGGQIGPRISPTVKESILQKLFSISLIVIAAKLIFDAVYKT
jgi:uncharacterized membrane protein YfcA